MIATDASGETGDEGLPRGAVNKNIGLVPILCSATAADARISNPSHLFSRFLGDSTCEARGFGTNNAVVLPLITSFRSSGTGPVRSPAPLGPTTVLYAERLLESGALFVDSDSMEEQVANEARWLAGPVPKGRPVAAPVLLPVTTKRFVMAEACMDQDAWAETVSAVRRPSKDVLTMLDLASDKSSDNCSTCFAVRWARLVKLFVTNGNDKPVVARMCHILGVPVDSPVVANIWPISKSVVKQAKPLRKCDSAVLRSEGLMTGQKWRMQHAHLPVWFIPVFLSAVNTVADDELHNVQQCLMQIVGQLSVLGSYENPVQTHAARALERVFATVSVIKTDTAMYLLDAAFSVGPIVGGIASDRERVEHLEDSVRAARDSLSVANGKIADLERRLTDLVAITEGLVQHVTGDST